MPIGRLTTYRWFDRTNASESFDDPSWSAVERAIAALDGGQRNDLYLFPKADDPHTWLCIGGGAGRYLVSGSLASERFPTLVDHTRPGDEEVTVTVGGQGGDYPANWVVDLPAALAAAKDFFDASGFEGTTKWTMA